MSKLAVKLFEEQENKKENYLPLVKAIFGNKEYDASLNENKVFIADAREALFALDESGAFGMLQRYFAEEYFLHGKSKEEIGKKIAENMDLLLADLETTSVRFLCHPEQAKALAKHIQK